MRSDSFFLETRLRLFTPTDIPFEDEKSLEPTEAEFSADLSLKADLGTLLHFPADISTNLLRRT